MLVSEITQLNIPVLHFYDTVEDAKELLMQNNLEQLPVLNEEKYAGLLCIDDLDDFQDSDIINLVQNKFSHISITPNQHLLTALNIISVSNSTILPVVTQNNEYTGTVSSENILHGLYTFLNCEEAGGIFVLEMQKEKFSVGELCRLVETNNAFVTQLNTYTERISGLLIVTLKINKTEISDILATLQRYDYSVRYYFGEEFYENELKENFDNLMAYLNI